MEKLKFQILIELTFMLIAKNKVTARDIMDRFNVSRRTAFRYIDALSLANVPVAVSYGRNGGFFIPEDYKLSATYFSQVELKILQSLIDLIDLNANDFDKSLKGEDFSNAKLILKEKLSAFLKDRKL